MIRLFKISGHSMEPVLHSGEYFLVTKFGKPKVNDIVVIMHPGKKRMFLVKRIKKKLKNGEYLVSGDNLGHSEDSRKFGAVKEAQIIGKLSFCYWPPEKFGFLRKTL